MNKFMLAISTIFFKLKTLVFPLSNINVIGFGYKHYSAVVKACDGGVISLVSVKMRRRVSINSVGGTISIGRDTFFNSDCSLTCLDSITIGSDCMFGEGVKIYDHDHIYDSMFNVSKNEYAKTPVFIGRNCWIGSNVIILRGASLCDNVIVAAGSVVRGAIDEPGVYVSEFGKMKKIK